MAWSNGYSYRRRITIDHTKCGTADSSNFPMLFAGTYSYLAHTDHSGNVTNASGYDIIFTTDASGSTKLDHEIESYNHETGAVAFWVRIPTLDADADTDIYLWYGKSSISSTQENITGVWDSNFKAVWHFGETSGTTLYDATENNNDLTRYSSSYPASVDGKIGKAVGSPNGEDNCVSTLPATVNFGNSVTISGWMYLLNTPWVSINLLWNGGSLGIARISNGDPATAGKAFFAANWGEYSGGDWDAVVPLSGWHHVVFTSTNPARSLYVDGALVSSKSEAADRPFQAIKTSQYRGLQDETRISNVVRSSSWILSEYNSQNSPSTFYTVGAADSGLSIPVLAYHCNRRRLQ